MAEEPTSTPAEEGLDDEEFLVGPVTYTKEAHIRRLGTNDVAIMTVKDGIPSFVEMVAPTEIPAP